MRTNLYWAIGGTLVCFAISQGRAAGTPPPSSAPPKAIADRQFVPRAGYARTTSVLDMRRKAAAFNPHRARPEWEVLSGVRSVPVILLAYKNVGGPFPPADFHKLLFGELNAPPWPPRPTLMQYYMDISHDKLQVTGKVLGWYSLPEKDTYYEGNGNGAGRPFGELLTFGLQKADVELDFGLFDNDGPDGEPNSGDDDGKVDLVMFVQPELGAESQRACPESAQNIWSHSWHYHDPEYGHEGPYVTRSVRKDTQGRPILDDQGAPQHIVVDDYTIQPALECRPGNSPGMIHIGVFCHEFGHELGLPDLYDRTPKDDEHLDSEGVGNWCLMAGGSYGGDGKHPEAPCDMSAWCKYYLGWASVETISRTARFNLESVEDRGRIYRIDVPNSQRKEYFLVEYRDKQWKDRRGVRINWDEHLFASGLAIWHVDERVGETSPNWPFAPTDRGQNDAPSRPGANPYALVALIQPDRKQDLEEAKYRGDVGDLWQGGVFRDDPQHIAGAQDYSGKLTGIQVSQIGLVGGLMLAEIQPGTLQVAARSGAPALATGLGPAAPAPSVAELRELSVVAAPQDSATRKAVHELLLSPPADLEKATKKLLETGPLHSFDIERLAPLEEKVQLLSRVAHAHTQDFTSATQPANPLESDLMGFLKQSAPREKISVQFDATRQRVERISGLAIPHAGMSANQSARSLVEGRLKPVLGVGVEFEAKSQKPEGAQRFQQVVRVAGSALPVWGAEATMYYDKESRLVAIQSTAVPSAELRVASDRVPLNKEQAIAIVSQQLALSPERIVASDPGVFLVGQDPGKGRTAYRVTVKAGEGRDDIKVYLDEATKMILEVH